VLYCVYILSYESILEDKVGRRRFDFSSFYLLAAVLSVTVNADMCAFKKYGFGEIPGGRVMAAP